MARAYGPHRPEDAPTAVRAHGPGKWPQLREEPLSARLVKQRRDLNNHAWKDADQ